MSYGRDRLIALVEQQLSAAPTTRLQDIANVAGVNRRTLHRALRAELETSFREFRDVAIAAQADRLTAEFPPKSTKEIAVALGFASPGSLARWRRRRKVTGTRWNR